MIIGCLRTLMLKQLTIKQNRYLNDWMKNTNRNVVKENGGRTSLIYLECFINIKER